MVYSVHSDAVMKKKTGKDTEKKASYTRVAHVICPDMRSPWERRTVVTCGDRVAAWETPDMYYIFGLRVDTGTRSCAPMINRNRQKPTLRDADGVVRSRNIADKFSFEYASPSLSLFVSFLLAKNEISFFRTLLSYSLITFFRPDPRKRTCLTNDYCVNT